MTNITIEDYTAEGHLVHYTIKVGDWEYEDHATTLDGAFKCITHNLKWDVVDFNFHFPSKMFSYLKL